MLEASFEIYFTIAQNFVYLFGKKNRNKVGILIDRLVASFVGFFTTAIANIFYYAIDY